MITLFILAGLTPVLAALGLILWRRYIAGEKLAGDLVGAVTIGLAAGVLLGGAVGGLLIALVLTVVRARGH